MPLGKRVGRQPGGEPWDGVALAIFEEKNAAKANDDDGALLVVQRDQRIDSRRAARRQVAGERGRPRSAPSSPSSIVSASVGGQPEQQRRDQPAGGERRGQADADADDAPASSTRPSPAAARRGAARRAPCGCRSRWCAARRCRTSTRTGRSTPAAAPARRTARRPARTRAPAAAASRPVSICVETFISGRFGSIWRTASRIAPDRAGRIAGGPHVEHGAAGSGVCRYGTYIVGGAASRTLSYLASRRTPTISICPAVSSSMPKCWPIGFSFGKYLRAAASLMIDDLRRLRVVAIGEAAARAQRHLHRLEEAGRDRRGG